VYCPLPFSSGQTIRNVSTCPCRERSRCPLCERKAELVRRTVRGGLLFLYGRDSLHRM
jgi:hypothetical protein